MADRPQPTNPSDRTMKLNFTEYADEYGSIALIHDPETEHAWIQSTRWTTVEP